PVRRCAGEPGEASPCEEGARAGVHRLGALDRRAEKYRRLQDRRRAIVLPERQSGGCVKRLCGAWLLGLLVAGIGSAQEPVRLYAAGSLRVALTEVAGAFEKQEGVPVKSEFGASGLLRERIEKGAPAEVFASADMGHPQTLQKEGRSGPVS